MRAALMDYLIGLCLMSRSFLIGSPPNFTDFPCLFSVG